MRIPTRILGFETQAEWDAFQEALSRKYDDHFYADLIRYVKGEANGIGSGTIGQIQAEIAKALIAEEPTLGEPDMRMALMAQVKERYDQEHAVVVKLDAWTMQDLLEDFERTADPYGTHGKRN
jgi:hypothetical protein